MRAQGARPAGWGLCVLPHTCERMCVCVHCMKHTCERVQVCGLGCTGRASVPAWDRGLWERQPLPGPRAPWWEGTRVQPAAPEWALRELDLDREAGRGALYLVGPGGQAAWAGTALPWLPAPPSRTRPLWPQTLPRDWGLDAHRSTVLAWTAPPSRARCPLRQPLPLGPREPPLQAEERERGRLLAPHGGLWPPAPWRLFVWPGGCPTQARPSGVRLINFPDPGSESHFPERARGGALRRPGLPTVGGWGRLAGPASCVAPGPPLPGWELGAVGSDALGERVLEVGAASRGQAAEPGAGTWESGGAGFVRHNGVLMTEPLLGVSRGAKCLKIAPEAEKGLPSGHGGLSHSQLTAVCRLRGRARPGGGGTPISAATESSCLGQGDGWGAPSPALPVAGNLSPPDSRAAEVGPSPGLRGPCSGGGGPCHPSLAGVHRWLPEPLGRR